MTMKTILLSALLLASTLFCRAQTSPFPGVRFSPLTVLLNGGTNSSVAMSSNAPIYFGCDSYTNVSFQAWVACPSGNSNLIFLISRSLDGISFESQPFATFVVQSSTTTNIAVTNLYVGSASSLRVQVCNTNSGNFITNISLSARVKPGNYKLSNN